MEKLKQAKSDEKFRERPVGPEASECCLRQFPPAEHDTGLFYDALRRIRGLWRRWLSGETRQNGNTSKHF